MIDINLIYFEDQSFHGNFGDELSKYITLNLMDTNQYRLLCNEKNKTTNIVCIGSYIHRAVDDCFIYGSGVRTLENKEKGHTYKNLKVCAVRGPLTREFLIKKKIQVPEIYGDPALLLPKFYEPKIKDHLKEKIGLVPHKSNYSKYQNKFEDNSIFFLINPTNQWENVIDSIVSCKAVVSSSLHGLICSDAYGIPNLWLDEFKLQEGDFKFKDYFCSQNRQYKKIASLTEYHDDLLYKDGNKIDLEILLQSFPFST